MGWKIESIRPKGHNNFFVYLCKKINNKFNKFIRPIIRAHLLKASNPILNFKSPKKPEPEG
jgi:hypothetical protein